MRFIFNLVLVLVWMLLIFMLSNEPSELSSERSDLIVQAISNTLSVSWSNEIMTLLVRKSAHIFAYFVLGILVFNIARDLKFKVIGYAIMVSILFAMAYAISDELHQLFVSGRSCELRDVVIDTIAATIGVMAYYLLCRIQNKLHKLQK